jgi:hypothetical protein
MLVYGISQVIDLELLNAQGSTGLINFTDCCISTKDGKLEENGDKGLGHASEIGLLDVLLRRS